MSELMPNDPPPVAKFSPTCASGILLMARSSRRRIAPLALAIGALDGALALGYRLQACCAPYALSVLYAPFALWLFRAKALNRHGPVF